MVYRHSLFSWHADTRRCGAGHWRCFERRMDDGAGGRDAVLSPFVFPLDRCKGVTVMKPCPRRLKPFLITAVLGLLYGGWWTLKWKVFAVPRLYSLSFSPDGKTRSQSTTESSSSASVQSSSSQSPSQIVESIISQIQSTNDEEGLRKLESEFTVLKYEYSNANYGLMEGAMHTLALACEAKRLGQPNWGVYVDTARNNAASAEKQIRNANNPAAQQRETQDWTNRINAEKARNGGRRY